MSPYVCDCTNVVYMFCVYCIYYYVNKFEARSLFSTSHLKLISTYCMDLYGSQLWNYGTGYPETFYVAWRKVTCLIWKLPFCTHCNLLHTINNCYSIEFILEKRCVNFSTPVYRVTM